MLCLPGFLPVIDETNAGGVSGGMVDVSVPTAPSAARRAKLGRCPSAIHGRRTRKLPPSMPMATTLRLVRSVINSELNQFLRCFAKPRAGEPPVRIRGAEPERRVFANRALERLEHAAHRRLDGLVGRDLARVDRGAEAADDAGRV